MLFAVATPMHMIAPVSDGTFSVVRVSNSVHRMPASAPGSAVMMMNGSSQDWKFTTISRYASTIAPTSPTARPTNDEFIVSTCPRMTIVAAARQRRPDLLDARLDVGGDRPEVASLRRPRTR